MRDRFLRTNSRPYKVITTLNIHNLEYFSLLITYRHKILICNADNKHYEGTYIILEDETLEELVVVVWCVVLHSHSFVTFL